MVSVRQMCPIFPSSQGFIAATWQGFARRQRAFYFFFVAGAGAGGAAGFSSEAAFSKSGIVEAVNS